MRKTYWMLPLAALVALGTLWCAADQAAAEEQKPLVVVSFSGYDALVADLDFIGKLGGNPNLASAPEAILKAMTQDKGLEGLDKSRPCGLVVLPNPDNPANEVRTFAFLPVTDLDKLLETLRNFGVESEDGPDGSKQLVSENLPPGTFVKQIGKWAFVTNDPVHFKAAPADPAALLGGLEKKYDLAVGLMVKNVPEPMKAIILGQLDMMTQMMAMQPEMNAQAAQMTQAIGQLKRYVKEIDAITLGLVINDPAGKTYLDVDMTALPDTETATELAEMKKGPSVFAGFYMPEATVTVNGVRKLSSTTIAQGTSMIRAMHQQFTQSLENQDLDEKQLEKAKRLTGDLVDVLVKTVEAGRMDVGVAAWLDTETATLVAGSTIAEPKKLDATLRELVALATKESPDLKESLKLDAETHEGVTLHVFTMPTASLDESGIWAELVGENLDVVIGIGPASAYLAAGRDATAKLKKAIEDSKAAATTDVLPSRMSIAVVPLVEFFSKVAPDEEARQTSTVIANVLKTAGSEDHVLMTTEPIPGGVRQRVEIEPGLLKTLGVMSQALTGMFVPTP